MGLLALGTPGPRASGCWWIPSLSCLGLALALAFLQFPLVLSGTVSLKNMSPSVICRQCLIVLFAVSHTPLLFVSSFMLRLGFCVPMTVVLKALLRAVVCASEGPCILQQQEGALPWALRPLELPLCLPMLLTSLPVHVLAHKQHLPLGMLAVSYPRCGERRHTSQGTLILAPEGTLGFTSIG